MGESFIRRTANMFKCILAITIILGGNVLVNGNDLQSSYNEGHKIKYGYGVIESFETVGGVRMKTDCDKLCRRNSKCLAWTLDRRLARCQLKNLSLVQMGGGVQSALKSKLQRRYPSDIRESTIPVLRYSRGAENIRSSDECGDICTSNKLCSTWSWFKITRRCVLYKLALKLSSPNFVSGNLLYEEMERPDEISTGTSSQPQTTTRMKQTNQSNNGTTTPNSNTISTTTKLSGTVTTSTSNRSSSSTKTSSISSTKTSSISSTTITNTTSTTSSSKELPSGTPSSRSICPECPKCP